MNEIDRLFSDPKYAAPVGLVMRSMKLMPAEHLPRFAKLVNHLDDKRALQDSGVKRGANAFDNECQRLGTDPAMIRRQLNSVEADYIVSELENRKSDRQLPVEPLSRRDVIAASFDALGEET